MQIRITTLVLGLALMVSSCGDDAPPKRNAARPSIQKSKPQIRIELDKKGIIPFGDTIGVSVSPINKELTIASLVISQPGFGFEMAIQGGGFQIPTELLGGGSIRLKVEATYDNGDKSSRYKEFSVFAKEAPAQWEFNVIRKYPHDPTSFTQGLLIYDNALYEGTGNYGESRLRKLDLGTGEVLQEREMSSDIFGEGITIFNEKIYQLTYKSSRGYVYDLASFEPEGEFVFSTETNEGWGLSHNDTCLIATDGSAFVYFLDPADFTELKRIKVFDNRTEIKGLNELEYHDGKLYANIYTTAQIIEIDPQSGIITDVYIARGVVAQDEITSNMDVLNGIAFNPGTGNMLITGKYWSKIYEVTPKPITTNP